MDSDKIAKFLADLREENNYTQYDLADLIHIRRESVSKWERGINMPSPDILLKLSDLYNVSVNELLLGEKITKENEYKLQNLPVAILKESHKRIKKVINRTIIIILLIALVFFTLFFVNNYKSIKIYTVNSNDYKIKDGIILLSRDACYLKLGAINTTENYNKYRLYFKENNEEKTLFIGNTKEITVDYNFISESEYNYSNILKAIENLYVDIYKDNEKINTITLNSNRVYNNDKITYSKEETKDDFVEYPDAEVPDYIKKNFKFDKENNQYVYEERKNDITYKYYYALDGSMFYINENNNNNKIFYEYNSIDNMLFINQTKNSQEEIHLIYNLGNKYCIEGNCKANINMINRFKNKYLPMIKDGT